MNNINKEYHNWKYKIISWIDSYRERQKIRLINRSVDNNILINLPKSTILGHNGIGVVIASEVKIGENVFIGHNVTIGNAEEYCSVPTIEDNVRICPHALIFGSIVVGHDSVIGGGAVVFKDVPPFSLVVGNCKIIDKGESNGKKHRKHESQFK